MNFYEFASDSPFLTFFLAMIVANVLAFPLKLVNQFFRMMNIRKQVWPPPHCDADGDFRPPPNAEEEP